MTLPEKPSVSQVDALRALLASPAIASKRWVYRQYDHMVRTNTLVLPGMGAGVVRVKGTNRALALSVDGNGRYCYLDPYRGAILAVVEAARNVACAGAEPIGATNCLNFGNPERPEIMWQFGRAVEGITAACKALDIPITGGNVSLYNETDGKAIYPTPVLGVVGLIEDAGKVLGRSFKSSGDAIVLLGETRHELGGSEYLKITHRVIAGVPPDIDLNAEKALQQLLVSASREGLAPIGARLCRRRPRCDPRGVRVRHRRYRIDRRCAGGRCSGRMGTGRDAVFGDRFAGCGLGRTREARRAARSRAGTRCARSRDRGDRDRPHQRLNRWAECHRHCRGRGRDHLG